MFYSVPFYQLFKAIFRFQFQFSELNRGEIQLSFKWIFDAAIDEENKRLQVLPLFFLKLKIYSILNTYVTFF